MTEPDERLMPFVKTCACGSDHRIATARASSQLLRPVEYRRAEQSELRDVGHLTDGRACCTTRWPNLHPRGTDDFTKRFDLGAEGLKGVGFRLAFLAPKKSTTNEPALLPRMRNKRTKQFENTSYDPATWLNALRARSAMEDFGSMLIARSNWERARSVSFSFA